jgi:RimJ/RimL family protein N-acetyltransferase
MAELQRLDAERALDVLAFELGNRAYFAASINDRGDAFFDHFSELYSALLAEQEAGTCACYLLVGENGAILGRFNLYDLKDDAADVGYRVGKRYAGCGLATTYVRELCGLAVTRHGLHTLRAATSLVNIASQRVLLKNGFVPVGPADPGSVGGKPGTWYQRDLTVSTD